MPRKTALLLAVTLLLAGCTGAPPAGQGETNPTDTITDTPTASPIPAATLTPTLTPTDTPEGTEPTADPAPQDPDEGPPTPTDTITDTPGDYPHSQAPEASHEVRIENRLDGNATVAVRVVREATGETVYDESVTMLPGERVVYNTEQATPDGGESFRVVAERSGETDSETIQMTECYGNVIVSPTDDGGVQVIYSVC